MAEALEICDRIDWHWDRYSSERVRALKETACTATVWPVKADSAEAVKAGPSLDRQEDIKARLESASGSFQRLKLVMDVWCALWFWPLEEMGNLPDRKAFLTAAGLLLGTEPPAAELQGWISANLGFEIGGVIRAAGREVPDAEVIGNLVPWMSVSREIAEEQRFHHWELVFSEVLGPVAERGGFDLLVGNPPWIKASWQDSVVLAEIEPLLGVKEARSAEYNRKREELLQDREALRFYQEAHRKNEGACTFLNSRRNYPELAGVQTNLYKNFMVRAWMFLGETGIVGLLHPDGPYDDAKGGRLREEVYRRLRGHFQFSNELILFNDVDHHARFSINVYGGEKEQVCFRNMANLFAPHTLADSLFHGRPNDPVPGIKTTEGKWETRPHVHRVVMITEKELQTYAFLLEDPGTPALQTRLPQVHAQAIGEVVEKLAKAPKRLKDLAGEYFSTEMFHESNAQRDGIITLQHDPSYQPETIEDWVLSGPHFYYGTPLMKTARSTCNHKNAYDVIDLTQIADDYIPRAMYRPGGHKADKSAFYRDIAEWPKPSLPGFWPVNDLGEERAWEILLGEPPKLYGVDPKKAGAKTARQFICLSVAEGDPVKVLKWVEANPKETEPKRIRELIGEFDFQQAKADEVDLTFLPRPTTSHYRYVNREMVSPTLERSLIPCILPPGATHIPWLSLIFFALIFFCHV